MCPNVSILYIQSEMTISEEDDKNDVCVCVCACVCACVCVCVLDYLCAVDAYGINLYIILCVVLIVIATYYHTLDMNKLY